MTYYNIESRKLLPSRDYRVGYRKSDGQAVRIYGCRKGWRIGFFEFCCLSQVSEYLETI